MSYFEIIKCHGSGNDFILVDTIGCEAARGINRELFARVACDRARGIGGDGVLFVERNAQGDVVMDMLNPDGTHAEMCGNGIRCVVRIATDRGYIRSEKVLSGGRSYKVRTAEPLAEGVMTFAVDIPLRLRSDDFPFIGEGENCVGEPISELDASLRFTALSPGNPHVVAAVESIDMELLRMLGERVKHIKDVFPNGVNVSLYERLSPTEIFVATYERGAGITLSCGTAMTSSATAAMLLGLVREGERVGVRNRGGKVYCTARIENGEPITTLEGNATIEWQGRARMCGEELSFEVDMHTGEAESWSRFVAQLAR